MEKTSSSQVGHAVARHLLKIGAIKLQPQKPFVWSSGWNSPIYCDNRLSLSYPEIRDFIKNELVKLIKEQFPQADCIAGVATAGIPQGAMIANDLHLPFVYVRSKPKGHGMENLIEGKVDPGSKAVVVEDLVSSGGSSLKAAQALSQAGCEILGMVAIFTYGFPLAAQNFAQAGISLHTLSDYSTMLEEALHSGYIEASQVDVLQQWREHPDTWKV